MASANWSFVTDKACFLSVTGWPLFSLLMAERDLFFFFFTEYQASDSGQGKCFTPGFQNILQRSISFSMYNTLERLIRRIEYLCFVKGGSKMTILWWANRSPLVIGWCAIAPDLKRIRNSGLERKPQVAG